jgi:hypothetical protein
MMAANAPASWLAPERVAARTDLEMTKPGSSQAAFVIRFARMSYVEPGGDPAENRSGEVRGGVEPSVSETENEPMLAIRDDLTTAAADEAAWTGSLHRAGSLPEGHDRLHLAQIGRLDSQKGWDRLAEVADELELVRGDLQRRVRREGLSRCQDRLVAIEDNPPGQPCAVPAFSTTLARRIEGGANLFFSPGRDEPREWNQLDTVPMADAAAAGVILHDHRPRATRIALSGDGGSRVCRPLDDIPLSREVGRRSESKAERRSGRPMGELSKPGTSCRVLNGESNRKGCRSLDRPFTRRFASPGQKDL